MRAYGASASRLPEESFSHHLLPPLRTMGLVQATQVLAPGAPPPGGRRQLSQGGLQIGLPPGGWAAMSAESAPYGLLAATPPGSRPARLSTGQVRSGAKGSRHQPPGGRHDSNQVSAIPPVGGVKSAPASQTGKVGCQGETPVFGRVRMHCF